MGDTSKNMYTVLLDRLLADSIQILDTLERRYLDDYAYLLQRLRDINVADESVDGIVYRRRYSSFYVARGEMWKEEWQDVYFSILEREKRNRSVSFSSVLEELHRRLGRVEPSFSSKLAATINPELPTYDSKVLEFLRLAGVNHSRPDTVKLRQAKETYVRLMEDTCAIARQDRFRELTRSFDERFPEYCHFTDIKKLDLFMWNADAVESSA